MKRSLSISLVVLLACGSASFAGANHFADTEQENARRARIIFPGYLGVELDEVSKDTAQRLRLGHERGAIVNNVIADSSAAKAGLQKDDVIVKWNGELIESAMELSRHLRETPAGRTVRLGVVRAGREIELDVTLGERSDYIRQHQVELEKEIAERLAQRQKERAERDQERQKAMVERAAQAQKAMTARLQQQEQRRKEMIERAADRINITRVGDRARLGIQLQSMSPQLAEYFGLSNRNGALVVFVYSDSPAAKAGLKAGDVIISIAGERVESPGDVRRALDSKSEGPVEVRVMRDRQERSITVQLEKGGSATWIEPDSFDSFDFAFPKIVMPAPKLAFSMPPIVVAPRITVPSITIPKIAPSAPVIVPKIVMPAMKFKSPKMFVPKMVVPKMIVPKVVIPPIKVPLTIHLYPKVV